MAIAMLVLVAALFVQGRRVASLDARLRHLTRGEDGASLEEVLQSQFEAVGEVVHEVDDLAARAAVLESTSQRALQRFGLVRYNPFDDTGGNQSFALALIDGREDGIVISSLHTRTATRIYAKSLTGGRSDSALSDEESQALAIARAGTAQRAANDDRSGRQGP